MKIFRDVDRPRAEWQEIANRVEEKFGDVCAVEIDGATIEIVIRERFYDDYSTAIGQWIRKNLEWDAPAPGDDSGTYWLHFRVPFFTSCEYENGSRS